MTHPTPPNAAPEIDAVIDESTIEGNVPTYAIAQWLNGNPRLKKQGGISYTGGFVVPFGVKRGKRTVENIAVDTAPLPGFTVEDIEFDNGTTQSALVAQRAALAVVRYRRCWFLKDEEGKRRYFPWSAYDGEISTKWRGKYQVLVTFKGWPFPVALTFTGTNSQALETALAALDEQVGKVGKALQLKKRLPRFGMWATLQAGPHTAPNEAYNSKTTPPLFDPTDAEFVGVEALAKFTALYKQAQGWVEQYNTNPTKFETNGQENGNGHSRPPVPEAPPDDSDYPF